MLLSGDDISCCYPVGAMTTVDHRGVEVVLTTILNIDVSVCVKRDHCFSFSRGLDKILTTNMRTGVKSRQSVQRKKFPAEFT
jgi:hypothetical protein